MPLLPISLLLLSHPLSFQSFTCTRAHSIYLSIFYSLLLSALSLSRIRTGAPPLRVRSSPHDGVPSGGAVSYESWKSRERPRTRGRQPFIGRCLRNTRGDRTGRRVVAGNGASSLPLLLPGSCMKLDAEAIESMSSVRFFSGKGTSPLELRITARSVIRCKALSI